MKVTHYFTASLTAPTPAVLYAVKGDGARMAVARLMAGAEAWTVPEGVTAGISYTLPDKTPGYYDRLEDGTPACMIAGNLVSAVIAPVLTGQAGAVKASIVLRDADGDQVATFPFQLRVEQAPGIVDAESVPAMGNGFEGKLFYGGPGGALTALALGDGVRVETTEDGTLALVAEGGSGGGGGIDEEKDPTVPAWAKQPQKPAYTAQEVGALPAGTKIPGKTSELTNDAGFVNKAVSDLTNYYTKVQTQELIAAIPRFRVAVVQQLPAAGEELVLYLVPFATAEGQYLEYIWAEGRWEIIGSQRVDLTGYATEEWVQEYVGEHSGQNVDLTGYAKEAWVQEGFQPKGDYLTEVPDGYAKTDDIPKVPNWAMQASKPAYTASEVGALPNTYTPPNQTAEQVGADPTGTAASAVSAHNTNNAAHNDIRLLIEGLTTRLNALANSTDTDLDQMAELVAYIKSNKSLIDGITTSKVSVADIVNNLTTNVANKPLSAAQGVAIKALIDGLSTGKLDASALQSAINTALAQAKASGEFDGAPGDDGYTPQIGKDYWTPADKAEIEAYIATELAKRGQLKPEFAQSLELLQENGDQTKLYVLPDGMIYAWMLTEKEVDAGGGYTNLLPLATDTDRKTIYGEDYDGDGDKDGYLKGQRLSSSGGLTALASACVSGFIPASEGDVLRIKNIKPIQTSTSSYVITYNSANTKVQHKSLGTTSDYSDWATPASTPYVTYTDGVLIIPLTSEYFGTGFDAIRFSAGTIDDTSIVTINEEIVEGGKTEIVKEYAWASTGLAFVPADYEHRLDIFDYAYIKNGELVANELDVTGNQHGHYTGVKMDSSIKRIMCKAHIVPNSSVVLISTKLGSSVVANITRGSIHLIFNASGCAVGIYDGGSSPLRNVVQYSCPVSEDAEVSFGYAISGNTMTVYLPDGTTQTLTDDAVSTVNGQYAIWEHYCSSASAGFKCSRITKLWCEDADGNVLDDDLKRLDGAIGVAPTGQVYRQFRTGQQTNRDFA